MVSALKHLCRSQTPFSDFVGNLGEVAALSPRVGVKHSPCRAIGNVTLYTKR